MLSFIWAEDMNGGIGKNNQIPWHDSDDMKHFKKTTMNKVIVMGMNTFKSLGNKPLPKRENFVLTHDHKEMNEKKQKENVHFVDKDMLFNLLKSWEKDKDEVLVIGGASIFDLVNKEFKPKLLHRTIIQSEYLHDKKMIRLDYDSYEITRDEMNDSGSCEFIDYQIKGDSNE